MDPGTEHSSGRSERRFYSGMAMLILVVALLGFARTYFLRPILPAPKPALPELTALIHLHAFLFSAWSLLLVVQARLVAGNRLSIHRRVGVAGAALAALMVVVGTLTAMQGAIRGVAPFGMAPLQFLIVPLFAIALFAAFMASALVARRRAQHHKRLILMATIALLPPAIARWALLLGVGPPVILTASVLFVLPLVAWDLRTVGRLHPVTLWAGLVLIASVPLRLVLSTTDGWLRLATELTHLVR